MRATVCQLNDVRGAFGRDWTELVAHVRSHRSELVVLPEMPFSRWFPVTRSFDAEVWKAAVASHTEWERRLTELASAVVLGTRPIDFGNVRYNAGFVWGPEEGMASGHVKSCLRNDEGDWETTWYDAPVPEFVPMSVGSLSIGMLIGSELWALEQAKLYGEDGVQILAVPRVTSLIRTPATVAIEPWLSAGCTAAIVSGAYCLSSTRGTSNSETTQPGWIISPDGEILGLTSTEEPFATADIDILLADDAKATYPRTVIFEVKTPKVAPPARPSAQAGSGLGSGLNSAS